MYVIRRARAIRAGLRRGARRRQITTCSSFPGPEARRGVPRRRRPIRNEMPANLRLRANYTTSFPERTVGQFARAAMGIPIVPATKTETLTSFAHIYDSGISILIHAQGTRHWKAPSGERLDLGRSVLTCLFLRPLYFASGRGNCRAALTAGSRPYSARRAFHVTRMSDVLSPPTTHTPPPRTPNSSRRCWLSGSKSPR